jgi:hypothetical protein
MQHRVPVRDDGIRNDLLVRRILLGLGAGEEKIVSARKKSIQVLLRLKVEPMKITQLLEETTPND